MELSFKHLLPQHFNNHAKVWMYQSSRMFSINEALELEKLMTLFVDDWQSHGKPVQGYANLFFGRFIVVMADETNTTVSGCSTDSSVHFIKTIEDKFKVNLFDRQTLAFFIKNKIEYLPLAQINYALSNQFIDANTLYFNNLVTTKHDLENNWIITIKESWLASKL